MLFFSLAMNESSSQSATSKLSQGISYFEEILQLVPEDRSALEFLAMAYGQQGNAEKRNQMVCRLADVLIAEKDLECAEKLLPTLQEAGTPRTYEAYNKIKAVLRLRTVKDNSPVTSETSPHAAEMLPAIKGEMALLQELHAHQLINDEAAKVVEQNLYETLSSRGDVLISALLFIKNENPVECEYALTYLADSYQTPPVPLRAFEIRSDLMERFPGSVIGRGVLPFTELGDTLLVAILNPADRKLRKQISDLAGCPCRFFIASPTEMEASLS